MCQAAHFLRFLHTTMIQVAPIQVNTSVMLQLSQPLTVISAFFLCHNLWSFAPLIVFLIHLVVLKFIANKYNKEIIECDMYQEITGVDDPEDEHVQNMQNDNE